jgi:glycerophosphoryl diester phosphodiesterase
VAFDNRSDHPYFAGPYPRAFAHRGWHVGDLAGMENSLAAFRHAVKEGYRYLETDVHATADGHVVVHHDAVLDRTTDGHGRVDALPWSRVCEVRVGGREPICALADLLEELPDALLNIDVKADSAVEPVLTTLRRANALERVCLASFSDARLARLRRLGGPRLVTSMGPRAVFGLWLAGRSPFGSAARSGARAAQVPVRQGPLTVVEPRFVRAAHAAGLEVHVWTVDDPAQMRRLLDLGVDGLVTDRPELLREVLDSRGPAAG